MSNESYSSGRRWAMHHDILPCEPWLEEQGFRPLDKRHFECGFRDEKAASALSGQVIPRFRECHCQSGCETDFPGLQGLG
ncbi:MAG TPA: hypothetical protein VEX16_03785 [Methyloceanibacter sp.]|nr:hypothetical protein [Methyloceanibacter sp.]